MDEHPALQGGSPGLKQIQQQQSGGSGQQQQIQLQQLQMAQQQGGEGGSEAGRPHYSMPGILHYIQHEWARFEMERASWDMERAELQARIAFLQGERKGQENLKKDLVRRIKMLEYALKQERAKYHKLKYGTELNQGDMKPPTFDADETNDTDTPVVTSNSQLTWRQGRQLLRQYLQEVGYTDTILDVRSQRVRSLLGLSGPPDQNGAPDAKNIEQILNGRDIMSIKPKEDDAKRNGDKSRSEPLVPSVLDTFQFLQEEEDSDDGDDDDDDEPDGLVEERDRPRASKKAKIGNEGLAADLADDPDTEEALKEFDFLVTTEDGEGAGEARSSGDGTEWGMALPPAPLQPLHGTPSLRRASPGYGKPGAVAHAWDPVLCRQGFVDCAENYETSKSTGLRGGRKMAVHKMDF